MAAGFQAAGAAPLVRNGATYLTYLKKSLPPLALDHDKQPEVEDSVWQHAQGKSCNRFYHWIFH